MSKRIVLFNHKGGVSKTTTTYNLGWKLAESNRVLLVDADPQCNLTSLLLCDNFDSYYVNEQTRQSNLRDGVEVAFKGKPAPIKAIDCFSPARQPNLFLIAGHPNLSEFEAALTFAQTSNNALATLENLPGAFSAFLKEVEKKYSIDYTIVDLNPGLSSINQNLIITSNYLIIPTNPDPFSLMAINTLRDVLPRWAAWMRQSASLFAESSYPLDGNPPVLLGTIIQRFNVRKGKAARPYRENIAEIKSKVISDLLPRLRQSGMAETDEAYGQELINNGLCLAEMPDFQGLLPKAIDAGVPVYALTDDEISETGPILKGMQQNREHFGKLFDKLTAEVRRLTEQAQ
ncbi:ParA family protein [Candidatus Electronema sp. PJ]|uniref:ParA family protein n=1 Tax=Candidatus Electronema sp. PJ TaxID=3401572 RepID=UPI003AA9A8E0